MLLALSNTSAIYIQLQMFPLRRSWISKVVNLVVSRATRYHVWNIGKWSVIVAIRSDSAGLEKSYLLDMLSGDDGCILEIGCGDGRLTRKYAQRARQVVGIDLPRSLPSAGRASVADVMDVAAASGVALPFRDGCFEQALFALSF